MTITSFALTSCSRDEDTPTNTDDDPEVEEGEVITLTGVLTEDQTWESENIYILDGSGIVD